MPGTTHRTKSGQKLYADDSASSPALRRAFKLRVMAFPPPGGKVPMRTPPQTNAGSSKALIAETRKALLETRKIINYTNDLIAKTRERLKTTLVAEQKAPVNKRR